MPKAKDLSAANKIPRPLNCFMTFRIDKQKEIASRCPGANNRDISMIVAKLWREMSEDEKMPYRERSKLAKMEHNKLYPGYRYRPNRKVERRRRKYTRRNKRDMFTSSVEENNHLMKILFENPRYYLSAPSLHASLASPSSSTRNRSCSGNDSITHNAIQPYFGDTPSSSSSSASSSLSDLSVDLFPSLDYCCSPSPAILIPFTPEDHDPFPDYFYHQQHDILHQELDTTQFDVEQPCLGYAPSSTTVMPGAFPVQTPAMEEMSPAMMKTQMIMSLDDALNVQYFVETEGYYLKPSYPSCYYGCPKLYDV